MTKENAQAIYQKALDSIEKLDRFREAGRPPKKSPEDLDKGEDYDFYRTSSRQTME